MRKKRRKFTMDFKREAVRIFESGQKPISVVARELGLHVNVLGDWVHRFGKDAPVVAPVVPGALTSSEMEAELTQLRKDKARLEMEVEILGKATAFFANRSR